MNERDANTNGKGLPTKRIAFVNEYLQCWNASQAARRAGYSARTAYAAGSFLLKIPEVSREIELRLKKDGMAAEEALGRLSAHARGSMAPFLRLGDRGEVDVDLTSREAQDNLHLIKKVRVKRRRQVYAGKKWEHESIEIELHDAQRALELLGRHWGLFDGKAKKSAGAPSAFIGELNAKIRRIYGTDSADGLEASKSAAVDPKG